MAMPHRTPRLRDLNPRQPRLELAFYSRCPTCETVWTNREDFVGKCPSCRPTLVPTDPIPCLHCGHRLALTREHLCETCVVDIDVERD